MDRGGKEGREGRRGEVSKLRGVVCSPLPPRPEVRACAALQHLPPPLPRHVAYVGWYTWLIRTPANLSVTLRSSNEVTVLRNLPIPCSNPRLWIPGSQFLVFAPPPPCCARRATSWHRASVPHPSPPLSRAQIEQRGHHLDFRTLSPECTRSWYDLVFFGLGVRTHHEQGF